MKTMKLFDGEITIEFDDKEGKIVHNYIVETLINNGIEFINSEYQAISDQSLEDIEVNYDFGLGTDAILFEEAEDNQMFDETIDTSPRIDIGPYRNIEEDDDKFAVIFTNIDEIIPIGIQEEIKEYIESNYENWYVGNDINYTDIDN